MQNVFQVIVVWAIKQTFQYDNPTKVAEFLCPPSKKEGHIALHISVGMSVSLNLVQMIT